MSYGVIYRLSFPDLIGDTVQLDIEERDVGDSITNLTCEHSPVQITFDTPSDFIFDSINGSRALIKMVEDSNFQFRTLYTSDVRKYRMSLYVSAALAWRGFLLPDQGSGNYRPAPNIISFIASDQLGYLKTLDWDRENVETELSVLGAIFNKTGLDLNLYEAIDVYEDSYNSTVADTPLDQTYINSEVFSGKTYYDALVQILFKYKAILKQDRGNWVIYRPENSGEKYTRRYYTFSAGVFTYSSNALYDPIVLTTSARTALSSIVRISNESPTWRISPAWQKYKLTQDYVKIENALVNGDFTEWIGNNPIEWHKSGTLTYVKAEDSLQIHGAAVENGGFLNDIVVQHDRVRISVDYEVYVPVGDKLRVIIRFYRRLDSGFVYYWNFNTGVWQNTSAEYEDYIDNSAGSEAVIQSGGFDFYTGFSFVSGTTQLFFSIREPVGDTTSYVRFKEASVLLVKPAPIYPDNIVDYDKTKIHDVEINSNNNADGGALTMFLNDLDNVAYLGHVYRGGLWKDSAQINPTVNWTDSTGSGKLVDLLKNGLSWYYLQPTELLRVSIYSKLVHSSSVIQEAISGTDRLYLIKKVTWDVKYCRWNIDGYEIGTGDRPAIGTEDDDWLITEDGHTLTIE